MREQAQTSSNANGASIAAPLMDIYREGVASANTQLQRNMKSLGERTAIMREGSERTARAAATAVQAYFVLAASAAELCWQAISLSSELSRDALVPPATDQRFAAGSSLMESLGSQMTELNAALSSTASEMMESFLITAAKGEISYPKKESNPGRHTSSPSGNLH
ncbi:hypothetical protein [Rhizorhapis sp.]|uniref:hypothetical protein n=1 Tax=Rhizorhapis sp. TaxID=1968842 RepID=UPI002B475F86|nr:hypothetical protein [Rhizorhapis sp.]HKR16331.1 hypothetical protein [Rhizorhapis sp.]